MRCSLTHFMELIIIILHRDQYWDTSKVVLSCSQPVKVDLRALRRSDFIFRQENIGVGIFGTLKKGVICDKKEEDAVVHQNELYGNLSNEDYFEERYDTNVVDTNENYQQFEEYEA